MANLVFLAHPVAGSQGIPKVVDLERRAKSALEYHFGVSGVKVVPAMELFGTGPSSIRGRRVIAAYIRYSDEKQHGNYSLDVQTELIAKKVRGDHAGATLVYFMDLAESGRKIVGREAYLTICDLAKRRLIQAVICVRYDRLGRNYVDQVLASEELGVRYGVEVLSATEPKDEGMMKMALFYADMEAMKIGRRAKDALASAAQQGYATGGATYGYRLKRINDPRGGGRTRPIYVVEPEEAKVVRNIFKWYIEGLGYARIAARLNEQKIVSPGGGTWDVTAVRSILYNHTKYRGYQVLGKVTRKLLQSGKTHYARHPEDEWLVSSKPAHAAIISVVIPRQRLTASALYRGFLTRCPCGTASLAGEFV